MRNRPNIFRYATSELSQDAFLLWLLEWANPQYADSNKNLNAAAQSFVRLLLDSPDLSVNQVKCYKQENHIDVFCIVNETYAILIEDKTDTSEHSNQLKRYTKWAQTSFPDLELHCIYYKTGNESLYKGNVLMKKYSKDYPDVAFKILNRVDMISCLSPFETGDTIIEDYLTHITKIETRTNAFTSMRMPDTWESWQGFYMCLERELHCGDWGYVPQKDGGFQAFWWNYATIASDNSMHLYLQFEQDQEGKPRLCIKVGCQGDSRPLLKWSNTIIQKAKEHSLCLSYPSRRRIGKTMTLAVMKNDYVFSETPMNIGKVCSVLKDLGMIIPEIANSL